MQSPKSTYCVVAFYEKSRKGKSRARAWLKKWSACLASAILCIQNLLLPKRIIIINNNYEEEGGGGGYKRQIYRTVSKLVVVWDWGTNRD